MKTCNFCRNVVSFSTPPFQNLDNNPVIRLNVGGTRYKVSRSLTEMYPDTVLARMIREERCKEDHEEIFIDRNGPRFQYVMRDQKITLPMHVSKESIFTELKFFGYTKVPSKSIDQSRME
jgi:hypothetical protein